MKGHVDLFMYCYTIVASCISSQAMVELREQRDLLSSQRNRSYE